MGSKESDVFSYAPSGLGFAVKLTHGLRRGLDSYAASRLGSHTAILLVFNWRVDSGWNYSRWRSDCDWSQVIPVGPCTTNSG